jgi:hypothetical protein
MVTLVNNYDRLGYYLVGWKKFYNKTLALIYAKQYSFEVRWIFNDDVYGIQDWAVPVEESLESLYLRRAKQIRDTYDYVILYYSGGSDSHNVLTTFVDNNIHIDEIVMELPEIDKNHFNDCDTSSRNVYGEILYVAAPRLKEIQNKLNPNTKIRFTDFSKPVIELMQKDNWFETMPTNAFFNLGQIGRQLLHSTDRTLIDLANKSRKVCQLYGVDKPLVTFDGNDYYAYFTDSSAMHVNPVTPENNKEYADYVETEFFYWTPDMPEIVIKQAQLIKLACMLDENKKEFWKKSMKKHIGEFRKIMHPIIYPGLEEPTFQTDKPESNIIRPMDAWFWNSTTSNAQDNYLYAIRSYLNDKISSEYFIHGDSEKGIASVNTRFYKL